MVNGFTFTNEVKWRAAMDGRPSDELNHGNVRIFLTTT